MTPSIGTPAYFAPEQTLNEKHYDSRVDVYAFGLVIFEICYPIEGFQEQKQWSKGLRKSVPIFPDTDSRLTYFDDEYTDLIQGMLQHVPNNRTSIDDVVTFFERKSEGLNQPSGLAQNVRYNNPDEGSDEGSSTIKA